MFTQSTFQIVWLVRAVITHQDSLQDIKCEKIEVNYIRFPLFSLCVRRLESPSYEVMQLEFEVDNVINLVSTQTLHWNVEYITGTSSRQTEKVSHLYISNADIQGIVPLAQVRDGVIDEHRYTEFYSRYMRVYMSTYPAGLIYSAGIDFPLHFPPPNLPADTSSSSPSG